MADPCTSLKLGKIGFLNVLPIYYPLESGIIPHPFSFIPDVPSALNALAAAGKLDISPVSSIEYARHAHLYYLVPDLSISSFGEVKSVLLLSRAPVHRLSGGKILLSSQSHTSVGLLKILCRLRFGIEPEFEAGSFADCDSKSLPDACLLIGDEALRLGRSGLYPHVLDLGAEWYEWTGLSFVYAVWVIRRKAAEDWNGRLSMAVDALLSAKKWGQSNLDRICTEAARGGLLSFEELNRYYRCLRFDLKERELRGMELFFSRLFEIGELDKVPGLDIYSRLASVA
ncbi:MAG: menaquinone biosynthesis protein [Desulfobacteraceae bacterium]|nr:menaquinone biosynthesis protein [Desulfobacteraceae bacterium]